MSGVEVAEEVLAGLKEVNEELGPSLPWSLLRKGPETGDSYDPTPGSETSYNCTVVLTSVSEILLSSGAARQGQKMALVAGVSVVPAPGDVLFNGVTRYTVESNTTIAPADVDILYKLLVTEAASA